MLKRRLVVFDFDGVIVDGMAEYWWSAWHSSCSLGAVLSDFSPDSVPETFRLLRPWVHYGWEMVLLAAELPRLDMQLWMTSYEEQQRRAMARRCWHPKQLQTTLEQIRQNAIRYNCMAWLALHRPFPGVIERLQSLDNEKTDWSILTTKSEAFATKLLENLGLKPWHLDGREAGEKPEVLRRLQSHRLLYALVEDRRATLETICSISGLKVINCLLARWGYLKPSDLIGLPLTIKPIDFKVFAKPLNEWP
ncbi:HAD family hydrolase [Synechococcus sp. M16CYN]|uniref:HAD family hydrolase n=1 Tax=Synechococcus sp. M16CYN TaxID=3103139 RepID=UPI0030E5E274